MQAQRGGKGGSPWRTPFPARVNGILHARGRTRAAPSCVPAISMASEYRGGGGPRVGHQATGMPEGTIDAASEDGAPRALRPCPAEVRRASALQASYTGKHVPGGAASAGAAGAIGCVQDGDVNAHNCRAPRTPGPRATRSSLSTLWHRPDIKAGGRSRARLRLRVCASIACRLHPQRDEREHEGGAGGRGIDTQTQCKHTA